MFKPLKYTNLRTNSVAKKRKSKFDYTEKDRGTSRFDGTKEMAYVQILIGHSTIRT